MGAKVELNSTGLETNYELGSIPITIRRQAETTEKSLSAYRFHLVLTH